MKKRILWQISVAIAREAEEGTAALLERLFARPATIYSPEQSHQSVATVYSTSPAKILQAKRSALDAGLQFLVECGLQPGKPLITIRRVPQEDWATSWRKSFKTLEFGSALRVRPSWCRRKPRPGQAVVTLDPGLSFGTGQHATTSFCLRQLVVASKSGQPKSFLDIGTGSGILAIAAVKLGYKPVKAFDFDPMSVRVAKANARRNRVGDKLTVTRQDLTQLSVNTRVQYDFICANLVQDLILAEAPRILARLRPGGSLVVAGLLVEQFEAVERVYRAEGLILQTVDVQGEWKSGRWSWGR